MLEPEAIQPWRSTSWSCPRDPRCAEQAEPLLDWSAGTWPGTPLGPQDPRLRADDQTSLQARRRCHKSQGPAPARPPRGEFASDRGGAWPSLAAWEGRQGYVRGRWPPTTGLEPWGRWVDHVLGPAPYCAGQRVVWRVDHGSSPRGDAAKTRLPQGDSRLILVHTPVHASGLQPIERSCAILHRTVLTPTDLAALAAIRHRVAWYNERSHQRPTPFPSPCDRTTLTGWVAKIAARQMLLTAVPCHGRAQAA